MNKNFGKKDIDVERLKAFEYFSYGPFLFEGTTMKLPKKYLEREEYHKWLDNDIRIFS